MAKKKKAGRPARPATASPDPARPDEEDEKRARPRSESDSESESDSDSESESDSDSERRQRRRKKVALDDAPRPLPPGVRGVVIAAAAVFVATVWLDGVGSTWPQKILPRPWVYFAQVAALFPHAAEMAIDYRAEGWSCAEKKWIEIDVRPYFQIERDTKENRFERVLYFFRKDRRVMRELDEYVVKKHNASDSGARIGGSRFLSLRIPFPPAGGTAVKWVHKPLADYPKEQRHEWYWTPKSKRLERCGGASGPTHEKPAPGPPFADDDAPSSSPPKADPEKDEP